MALRLGPDLPQAHLAAGLAHYTAGDTRGALAEFKLGRSGAPNDAELWGWIGNANLGLAIGIARWWHSTRRGDSTRETRISSQTIGDAYHYLHRYREAIAAYRRVIELAPDVVQARLSMAWSYILWKGDLDTLRAVLHGLPRDADPGMGGGPVSGNRLAVALDGAAPGHRSRAPAPRRARR